MPASPIYDISHVIESKSILLPIEHLDLNEKVYRILRERILRRDFKAGEKLDIYRLSDQINVSRTPVKDAFNRLSREGLVEIIPRRGTFVTKITRADVEELFEARLMIELFAARQGLKRMNGADLRELSRLVEKGGRILARGGPDSFNYEAFSDANAQLHLKMVRAARNRRIEEMYKSLNLQVQIARAVFEQAFEPCSMAQKEHEQILKSYQERDFPTLKKAIQQHLARAEAGILETLEERGGVL